MPYTPSQFAHIAAMHSSNAYEADIMVATQFLEAHPRASDATLRTHLEQNRQGWWARSSEHLDAAVKEARKLAKLAETLNAEER